MDAKLLPFLYAGLIFSVLTFLFLVLWRIFMNVETFYVYEFEVVPTTAQHYVFLIEQKIVVRGKDGWKYEGKQIHEIEGIKNVLLIFQKTKSKVRLF